MSLAGKREHYIEFQRATVAADSIGHPVKTWNRLRYEWASFDAMSGMEVFKTDRRVASETGRFVVPYFDGLLATDRIVHDDKNWTITYIRTMGRRQSLEILAEISEL